MAGGPLFACLVDVPHTRCELGRKGTNLPLCNFDPWLDEVIIDFSLCQFFLVYLVQVQIELTLRELSHV